MKKIQKQLRYIFDGLYLMIFLVFFCSATFVSCQNKESAIDDVSKDFKKRFGSVSKGNSTNIVMEVLGKPSRILAKPPMNGRIPDGKEPDAVTAASIVALKNVYFELWQYDMPIGEYGIVFKPVAPLQKQLVVHSKYFQEACQVEE